MSKILFFKNGAVSHDQLASAQFSDISQGIFYLFNLHHSDAMVTVTRHIRRSPSPASWLSDISYLPVCVSILLPSPSSSHLGFLCRVFLSVREYSLQSLSLSHSVRHLRPTKTIDSNLVSLHCCHNKWVSSAKEKRYLWPTEVYHSRATLQICHTDVHRATFTSAAFISSKRRGSCEQVYACRHTRMSPRRHTYMPGCTGETSTRSHGLLASRNCDHDEWISSSDRDRTVCCFCLVLFFCNSQICYFCWKKRQKMF